MEREPPRRLERDGWRGSIPSGAGVGDRLPDAWRSRGRCQRQRQCVSGYEEQAHGEWSRRQQGASRSHGHLSEGPPGLRPRPMGPGRRRWKVEGSQTRWPTPRSRKLPGGNFCRVKTAPGARGRAPTVRMGRVSSCAPPRRIRQRRVNCAESVPSRGCPVGPRWPVRSRQPTMHRVKRGRAGQVPLSLSCPAHSATRRTAWGTTARSRTSSCTTDRSHRPPAGGAPPIPRK